MKTYILTIPQFHGEHTPLELVIKAKDKPEAVTNAVFALRDYLREFMDAYSIDPNIINRGFVDAHLLEQPVKN